MEISGRTNRTFIFDYVLGTRASLALPRFIAHALLPVVKVEDQILEWLQFFYYIFSPLMVLLNSLVYDFRDQLRFNHMPVGQGMHLSRTG